MREYFYEGAVLMFDKVVSHIWTSTTFAVSEKKARCNLAYQFKKQLGLAPTAKITLPGPIKVVE